MDEVLEDIACLVRYNAVIRPTVDGIRLIEGSTLIHDSAACSATIWAFNFRSFSQCRTSWIMASHASTRA